MPTRRRNRATVRRRRAPRQKDRLKQRTAGRKPAGPAGPVPAGWPILAIKDQRDGRELTCLITEDGAKADGYGGWEEVARARRIGFPDWTGGPLLHMDIGCMFDGWQAGVTVDRSCRMLESFARTEDDERPPTVRIDGPVPHTDKTWVIESIEWGAVIRGEQGRRRRVEFTLGLMQWVNADVIKKSSAKKRRKGKGRRRTAKVRKRKNGKPETLMQFSARVLDDASKWRAVKRKNPKVRDPRKLKVGWVLKLP